MPNVSKIEHSYSEVRRAKVTLLTKQRPDIREFHIGIDDTDSEMGGCTTYTAAVLFQELFNRGFKPSDFPWLVRLNPNIPWKTRGNGALAIHFFVDEERIEEVHALAGVRGMIGSLAAIGADLDFAAHTFEIIAYRIKENLGSPRRINHESVKVMNAKHNARTFNNLDPESGRVLVSPHGLDPVLLGIRGYSPDDVLAAFKEVRLCEEIERIMIFRTNQGTDAHLGKVRRAVDLKPHQSGGITGRVEDMPRVLRGGHVIFGLRDDSGSIDCAVYRPTGSLAMVARDLLPGDRVRAFGGVRGWREGRPTINVEKLDVLHLVEKVEDVNPMCGKCGGRCESMGRGQGLRCKKCGQRIETASKIQVRQQRQLQQTVYIPPPRARRHLTMPDSTPRNLFQHISRVEEFQLRAEDYN